MTEFLNNKLLHYTQLVNDELDRYLSAADIPDDLLQAMRYSVFAGGKRLRPAMLLESCIMCGGKPEAALPFAAAIEMIHTYSLIHDDLPALDNDDYRRGMLTSHKKFGEDRAILAGDALLSYAFEIMLENCDSPEKVQAAGYIAHGAGVSKMVAGQWADVTHNGESVDKEMLEYIHLNKTAAMITGALTAGASIAGENKDNIGLLALYGTNIGCTFQIVDDILDVTSTSEALGKPIGSDAENNKTTYVTVYGLEGAREKAALLTECAVKVLDKFDNDSRFLRELAYYILERDK